MVCLLIVHETMSTIYYQTGVSTGMFTSISKFVEKLWSTRHAMDLAACHAFRLNMLLFFLRGLQLSRNITWATCNLLCQYFCLINETKLSPISVGYFVYRVLIMYLICCKYLQIGTAVHKSKTSWMTLKLCIT